MSLQFKYPSECGLNIPQEYYKHLTIKLNFCQFYGVLRDISKNSTNHIAEINECSTHELVTCISFSKQGARDP